LLIAVAYLRACMQSRNIGRLRGSTAALRPARLAAADSARCRPSAEGTTRDQQEELHPRDARTNSFAILPQRQIELDDAAGATSRVIGRRGPEGTHRQGRPPRRPATMGRVATRGNCAGIDTQLQDIVRFAGAANVFRSAPRKRRQRRRRDMT